MDGPWEPLLRLLIAALLGAAIGFEREFNDQPAGFRTHLLVSLGAATFTVAGAYGFGDLRAEDGSIDFDPTRVAAQVVTGIGFLGAGAILQRGLSIRGLTTAASLWVTAAIGLAAGSGYWEAAVATAAIALLALYGLKHIGQQIFPLLKDPTLHLSLETRDRLDLGRLEAVLTEHHARLRSMRFMALRGGRQRLAATLEMDDKTSRSELARELSKLPGVDNVDWRE